MLSADITKGLPQRASVSHQTRPKGPFRALGSVHVVWSPQLQPPWACTDASQSGHLSAAAGTPAASRSVILWGRQEV